MDELAETCERARRYARAHPITEATLNVARYRPQIFAPYSFRVAEQYDCMVMYETFRRPDLGFAPPLWHGQIAVMENIGDLSFGAVQLALVSVKDWLSDDMKRAMEILGEALGSEIRRHDQDVHVHAGLWNLHWFTEARIDEKATAN
jgi:hypothetical protein